MHIEIATRSSPTDEWKTTIDGEFDGTFAKYCEDYLSPQANGVPVKEYITKSVEQGIMKIESPKCWTALL